MQNYNTNKCRIYSFLINDKKLKGNPQNIQGLQDVIDREDIGIVVNDGNRHGTLTSLTGVWEDVVGRTMKAADVAVVRAKILHYGSGSGDSRDQLLDETSGIDVWFSWYDWYMSYGY